MLKIKAWAYAIFSILIPLVVYISVFFPEGISAARIAEARVYVPLVVSHAVGLGLSVLALWASGKNPVDTSPAVLVAVLLGTIGVLANLIAFEIIVYAK